MSTRWTLAQVARRREAALQLYLEGWGIAQIQGALGLKSPSTVTSDLKALYPDREFRRGSRKSGKPEPVDWLSEPEPSAMNETVLRTVRGFLADLAGQNYRNSLAWAVSQAESEGAARWLADAQRAADELSAAATAIAQIITDAEYRRQMAHTSAGRDDVRTEPRPAADETLVTHALDLLEAGRSQKAIGVELGLADNSMRLAAIVAVARERLRQSGERR